jgi:hypothetical protein
VGPAGITTNIRNVDARTIAGASPKISLSESSVEMSSFCSHLPTSARSCSEPYGPASMGPSRLCMKLTNLNRYR